MGEVTFATDRNDSLQKSYATILFTVFRATFLLSCGDVFNRAELRIRAAIFGALPVQPVVGRH